MPKFKNFDEKIDNIFSKFIDYKIIKENIDVSIICILIEDLKKCCLFIQ